MLGENSGGLFNGLLGLWNGDGLQAWVVRLAIILAALMLAAGLFSARTKRAPALIDRAQASRTRRSNLSKSSPAAPRNNRPKKREKTVRRYRPTCAAVSKRRVQHPRVLMKTRKIWT